MRKETMPSRTPKLHLEIEKDIDSRLQTLHFWKQSIHEEFDRIILKNPLDEIKDLISQLDQASSRNNRLKVALFQEENPDFKEQRQGQVHSMILNSMEVFNENEEREIKALKAAIAHIGLSGCKDASAYLKRAI